MPSLRYIIYVDSRRVFLSFFQRAEGNQWLNTDYDHLDDTFEVEGKTIAHWEVYSHLNAAEKEPG